MPRRSLTASAPKTTPIKRERSGSSSGLSDAPDVASAVIPAVSASQGAKAVASPRSKKSRASLSTSAVVAVEEIDVKVEVTPSKKARKPRASTSTAVKPEDEDEDEKPRKRGKKAATDAAAFSPDELDKEAVRAADTKAADGEPKEKKKRVAKAKIWPPEDLHPDKHPQRQGYPLYDFRTGKQPDRPMLLGAHVSIGGGPAGALLRAGMAGANGLAMFVKSQRKWDSPPYEPEAVERFRALLRAKEEGGVGYRAEDVLVHGSYLINLGNPDQTKWKQAYSCFKDDLYRCHQLGLKLYNWHPGSTVGACSREQSYASIAKAINMAHNDVPEVITVIENMANAGSNIIGTAFADLAGIIALVEDKTRVKVCLDTCHMFAAGYDIRTPAAYAATMKQFDEEVGFGYLGGMHLNDSKADLGGKRDLHENIGLGKIGLSAFRSIMRDPRLQGIPLVLETPAPDNALEYGQLAIWTREIKLLYDIQRIEDAEWEKKEGEVAETWRKERDELNPPKEKGPKKVKKGKKGDAECSCDEDD